MVAAVPASSAERVRLAIAVQLLCGTKLVRRVPIL
jgi:hypothetical protein